MIRHEIPFAAISTNRLYTGRKRRSWQYEQYRKQVLEYLALNYNPLPLEGNLELYMDVGFSSSLSDCSNSVKGIEDIVAEFNGFNDKKIIHMEVNKYLVDKGKEFVTIELKESEKDYDRRTKKTRRSTKKSSAS